MSFEPVFIKKFEEFTLDKQQVRSMDDLICFEKKWFDKTKWPEKSSSQLASESLCKRGPVNLDGREWSYIFWSYDLTPEARYEYFAVLKQISDPIKFPHEIDAPKTSDEGWRQECLYCEMSTDEIGEEICLLCGRQLIYVRYSE